MAAVKTLCMTLNIDRLDRGLYRAEMGAPSITRGGELSVYASIEEAIRGEAEDLPDGMCHFVEVRYSSMSSGTIPLAALSEKAGQIAAELVALVAEAHRLEH